MNERLVAFLYILMRDHLVAGSVEQIIVHHVDKMRDFGSEYSNQHLETYAREIAMRLTQ